MASQSFGKYVVTEVLGRGAMAAVYQAYDPGLDRRVAIKVIHPYLAAEEGFGERFQREARLVASLRHPHIVQLHDYDVVKGQAFMVMEYLPEGTLKERLAAFRARGERMPVDQIQHLLAQLASALDYAHGRGAIHRDIKPTNILFTSAGEPVLTDFGIAKILGDAAKLTMTGGVVGTPAYMAPEQAAGEWVDGRSDLYSLGVVLYEMATGRVPFEGDSPTAVMKKHLFDPPPPPRAFNPTLPAALEAVILKVLEKDPNKRYSSAGELARAFKAAAEGTQSVSLGTGADEQTQIDGEPTVLDPSKQPTKLASKSLPPSATIRRFEGQPGPTVGPTHVVEPAPPSPAGRPNPNGRRPLAAAGFFGVLLLSALIVFVVAPQLRSRAPAAATASPTVPAAAQIAGTPTKRPTQPSTATATTALAAAGSSNIYLEYILDASGSMLEPLEGTTRLAIAQKVLTSRISALPPSINVGLRVYGHRIPWQEKDESCKDIELVVPIRTGGAERIVSWLATMNAQGMTPMSESIRQAADDFTFEAGRNNSIILISDGIETCGDDPSEVVRYLREIGINFTIHVIGLAVDEQARAQLRRIAEVAGGIYHDADSETELSTALGDLNEAVVESGAQATSGPVAAAATSTPTPAEQRRAELAVGEMRITLETGDRCDFQSTNLGIRVVVANRGEVDAGPFTVEVNGAQQTVAGGLAAGQSTSLWFAGYNGTGENTATVDATNAVPEGDEGNNSVSQQLPVPTLPPACTPTPAPPTPLPPTPVPPTPIPVPPTATPAPQVVNATAEGAVEASSTFPGYSPGMAVDGNRGTSWFSAGSQADGASSTYRWSGARDDLITSVTILSNAEHGEPGVRTGFGFQLVTVQVLDASGAVVYEERVDLPGTPDPDVVVRPNVVGRSVVLVLSEHEDPTCGGFSELLVEVAR